MIRTAFQKVLQQNLAKGAISPEEAAAKLNWYDQLEQTEKFSGPFSLGNEITRLEDKTGLVGVGAGILTGGGALGWGGAGAAGGGASTGGTGSSLLAAELAAPVSIAEMNAAFPGLMAGGATGGGAGLLAAETAAPVPFSELQAAFPGGLGAPGGAGAGALASGAPAAGGTVAAPAAGGAAASTGLGGLLSNPQLLGAGIGALSAGLGGGSSPAGTITVEEDIPDWLQPYVKPQLDKYSSLLQNHQTDPYGVMPAAMQQFKDTVSGQFLDPSTNKWLEQYYNLGAERVKGSLSPSFGHMQAFGSHSGYNEALSRGLGDFATQLYGGAYEKERDRQNQMIAAAPNFLTGASQSAFAPYQDYLNTVGNLGRKKTEPYFDNKFGNTLGGAMAGFSLGGLFK